MKTGVEAWMAWFQRSRDRLVDMGTQLSGGRRLTASGSSRTERNVVGYSIVGESMEAAESPLADHPHLT